MAPEKEITINEGEEGTLHKYYPFLLEIRNRLKLIFVVFLATSLLGFVYYEKIVTFSLMLFRLEGVNFAFTSPFQFINLAISSGLTAGMIASLPLVLYQVVSFLKPALSEREYKFMVTLIPLAIFLFVGGFFYGIFVMRYVMNLFYLSATKLSLTNLLDVSSFLSQIISTSALMAVAFEFPIVLTALLRLKVLDYENISSQRPTVYFICLLFAALLPPTDLLSLALLTVPLIFLFESTLFINKAFLRPQM